MNMEQNMERDASIYVFHADTEGLNFRKAFKAAGFYLFRYVHLEKAIIGLRKKSLSMAA